MRVEQVLGLVAAPPVVCAGAYADGLLSRQARRTVKGAEPPATVSVRCAPARLGRGSA